MLKKIVMIVIICACLFCFISCIPGDGTYIEKPAGFFSGVWHGWIAPLSLVLGLLDEKIRVYEKINTGWAYDFGFYMAIISGFGGLSLFRKKNRNNN